MRNLLIFVLVLILVWWARRALQKPRDQRRRRRHDATGGSGEETPERMLSCAHCGLHVPESEGVREDGRFFCSEDHRRLGVRR
ncbi:PP0621 family protein [Rhodocyclaceae bacterium SMB388]